MEVLTKENRVLCAENKKLNKKLSEWEERFERRMEETVDRAVEKANEKQVGNYNIKDIPFRYLKI